jgi:hypothetical protein
MGCAEQQLDAQGLAMAWTQDDLDALDAAIATGVKKVQYANGSTEYQSLNEMLTLRDRMADAVNPGRAPARTSFAQFSRD